MMRPGVSRPTQRRNEAPFRVVSIFDTLRMRRDTDHYAEQVVDITAGMGATLDPSTLPIASPWSSSNLERIVFEDYFGTTDPPNTRAAAMRLPAVARARNLVVSTLCKLPLVMLARGEQLPPLTDAVAWAALWDRNPSWMHRADDGTSPQLRLAWTVDDLMFYGWSCWWRRNGADGYPIAVGRLDQGSWTINADNRVEVHGIVQADDAVILIPGLHEGLLSFGRTTLDDAHTLYRNVRARLVNPVPQLELHQTGGQPLNKDERDELIIGWAAARSGKNGGVGYTSKDIETKELGAGDAALMIEARNAASLDLARMVGVSAGMIDATAPKASLNYETTSGRNQEFVDLDLALYMTPITARLSLDDVMPRGSRAVFDTSDLTGPVPSPTGPNLAD